MAQEAMIRWFESWVRKIRDGEALITQVPLMLYEYMDDNGNISATPEEKYGYVQRARDFRMEQLQRDNEKFDSVNSRWRLSAFVYQSDRGYFEGEEADIVRGLAKQMLLYDTIINSQS